MYSTSVGTISSPQHWSIDRLSPATSTMASSCLRGRHAARPDGRWQW
jgi:hypothetical protein